MLEVNKYVKHYIDLYKEGKVLFNKERIQLIHYLEKYIFPRDDIYFDDEAIENLCNFARELYFELDDFQKFISAFLFLYYKEDNENFYDQFFIMGGRGVGKNGLVSVWAHYFLSDYNPINEYDISIVANTEKQAKTSFMEIYNCIERNNLDEYFRKNLKEITGRATNSKLQYHTSAPKSKDGLKDGMVVYDEIHRMEGYYVINVFGSGLGKKDNPREIFIGSNGHVRGGVIDDMLERASKILSGEVLDDNMFCFLCKIDDAKEADDPNAWEKANPQFSEPMTPYAKRLFKRVKKEHQKLSNNLKYRAEFMAKRMNFPETDLTESVATADEIYHANKDIPDLLHKTCVGGLDFGSVRDFTAVGLLFRKGDDYFWLTHSFARKEYLDKANLKPPIHEWAEKGLLTIVDEPTIDPRHVVDWFVKMRELYNIEIIVADMYKLDILRPLLEAEGFEVHGIRRPSSIHGLLAPRVESLFANNNLYWGINPLMNWYTFNVFKKVTKDGSIQYLKKDEHRRKTDGFQALIHALYKASEILTDDIDFFLDEIEFTNY
ncbi:terminase large subunit [Staphylococcus aureus]|uniref:terminase TerL endonuclease subunit n=1 Tax=Staphylococcus aureus TaxID=1280 RepID=UPI002DBE1C95|nr:terminase TerL endonuclease subunit [Staphylococcus aureus]MEB6797972.1 terminase large subunit [Staphylococcus aureus]MEB6816927.1 terminase large subunit [Staphylococcus aureus]